jgi:DNA invertase Pin-like site-specific DNA recombinase
VRRQLADCEDLAARKGWTVVDRYVDDDVSAWSGHVRPEYRRLLDDLRAGLLDAVVVWHLDRLHRQPRELEEFFEVVDGAGLSRLASVTGDVDLATDDGRFMARILGAVSRKESDDKSRRIRRKAEEIALSGRVGGGGTRPYGFEPDRVTIQESEAAVIRECVARFLAGEAIRSICNDLNERGVATVAGGAWKTQTLTRLLGSPRISGQREHRGEIVADAEWPAIVSPADTARVRAILSDPSRRTNRTARRYLLVRLLRCGLCGETLVSRPTSGGVRRYICARGTNFSGCGHTFIQAGTLELFIVEAVLYRLDTPELAAALTRSASDPVADRCQAELVEAQAHLDELARAYGERSIGLSEWLIAREPIEARVTSAKKQLARLSRVSALDGHVGHGSTLRDAWPGLPLTRQRAIVAAVLDHAVIGPGRRGYNRFEPDRVTPVWRI